MRVALDTNILAYAEGLIFAPADVEKSGIARRLLAALIDDQCVVALQSLAELHRLLVRKARRSPPEASAVVRAWLPQVELLATDSVVFDAALELTAAHGLQVFDAIILAAAAEAHCDFLLSEDLADGFVWRGVVVANPFAAAPHPQVAQWLAP